MTKKEYEDIMVAIESLEYIARDVNGLMLTPVKDLDADLDDILSDMGGTIEDFYRILSAYKHLEEVEK